MAGKSSSLKLVGLVLLVIGAGLGYWGYELSQGLGSQLSQSLSGSMPDEVMYRYIAGAASFVAGLYLLITN